MKYRRFYLKGGYYFFTLVTQNRRSILIENIELLRESFSYVMAAHPFRIDAAVVLPDHLHMIWKLPEYDSDYSSKWRAIKSHFSKNIPLQEWISPSRKARGQREVWQNRFLEHTIRNESDYIGHIEYIHNNPVKHGLVDCPIDWPYSSIHKYIDK